MTQYEIHLEKVMFDTWLKESGETNEADIDHLRNCVHLAVMECLTKKQRQYLSLYLSGYNMIEIAEMCSVNKSAVSRTIGRGLDHVLDHIKYASPRTLQVKRRVAKRLSGLYRN